MANITIRNIPDNTKKSLRVQAAKSGISLEEHARQILNKASANEFYAQQGVLELAGKYFGAESGVDLDLPLRTTNREEVEFKK